MGPELNALRESEKRIMVYIGHALGLAGDPPVIVECGAHDGQTAFDLYRLLGERRPKYYAFEPDPRNVKMLKEGSLFPKDAVLVETAVGSSDGEADFHLSQDAWTYSNSIRKPKEHLNVHPWVHFEKTSRVRMMRLDTFFEQSKLERIDLLWADIQGAERDMVAGAPKTLTVTRFMFLEQDVKELYEGQWTLDEMIRDLEPSWGVSAIFPTDILFWNKKWFDKNPLEGL
jgi:FkbM family methyltransferase